MTDEQYNTLANEIESFAKRIRNIESGLGSSTAGPHISGERKAGADHRRDPAPERPHGPDRKEVHMDNIHSRGNTVSGWQNIRPRQALVNRPKIKQFIEDNIVMILFFGCALFLSIRIGMVLGKYF